MEPAAGELFKMVVLDEYTSSNREELDERKVLLKLIEEQETMLSNSRRRLVKEEIDSENFKILKKECNEELKKLEGLLSEIPAKSQSLETIEGLLDIVVEKLINIDERYAKADLPEKRQIIGSMFIEKISFDGVKHRTARVSEPLDLLLLINKEYGELKKGKSFL